MTRKRLAVWIVVLVLLAGCTSDDPGQVLSGGAPDFLLPAVDGSMVRMSDHDGKVIIVDFWATWCPPCEEMIPVLSKLHRNYSEKGLVILGISLDREGLGVLGTFVHEKMIPYKVLLGNDKVTRSFGGVSTIPTLYIVGRDGRLVRKLTGYHSYGQLEDQVKKYLEEGTMGKEG